MSQYAYIGYPRAVPIVALSNDIASKMLRIPGFIIARQISPACPSAGI
jgi:hypothetical protein